MEEKDNPKLYRIRHSFAHVLAQAVKDLYPKTKLGFGPPIDNGFYYDFDFGDAKIAETDLKEFEKRMKKIIGQRQEFIFSACNYQQALEKIQHAGDESYKIENIKKLYERGEQKFTFYQNSKFLDLCEGPHVKHTGELPADAFKLDRIAGAYWLGDEKNRMLTRIYGLAFETKPQLDEYLKRRQMAQEFDHHKLGKELDIYHQENIVGKGLPLWLPNGTVIRDELEKYAKELEFKYGYKRVWTPHITRQELYMKSQHLESYRDSMFPPMTLEEDGKNEVYYLKPMNCPHHHLIYGSRLRSYRELPLRLAEYGTVYRYEQSGETSGLIRVRGMTMNDAHIYLRLDQFEQEFKSIMNMYMELYKTLKLKEYKFRLSIRGKDNEEKFKGDPQAWNKAEALLKKVMDDIGLSYFIGEGEAAFYGPKIDIQFKNLMGREETVSTIQVDFLAAKNFDLKYIAENGSEEQPIVIHRAPLSTHERLVSFLIEYYGGAFPTWCSPIQVMIIPVNDDCLDYCKKIQNDLFRQMMRVEIDDSANSFNKKIRTNTVRKIPILLIIGNNEKQQQNVTVRRYGLDQQQQFAFDDFYKELQKEISERVMFREPMGSLL